MKGSFVKSSLFVSHYPHNVQAPSTLRVKHQRKRIHTAVETTDNSTETAKTTSPLLPLYDN